MSDYVSASAIKDLLTECPICTEHFDETRRTPRRMPCCVQSICESCLETYSKGLPTLSCPMCRHQHNLPGGVKSLSKEPIILRILDHLKIVKGLHLPCTDCPDGNPAMSRCDDCGDFLCQECLNAHKRVQSMRDHQTVSFKEMKEQPGKSSNRLHKCAQHRQPLQFYCYTCEKIVCVSCTVVDHKEGNGHNVVSVDEAHEEKAKSIDDTLVKLREKAEGLEEIKQGLQERHSNIQVSKQAAVVDINNAFDKLIDEIQQRRVILLSDVEERSSKILKLTQEELDSNSNILAKVTSSTEYTQQMRSKADTIEDLQMMGSSAATLSAMLEMWPKASLGRAGVSFASTCFSKITPLLKMAGLVKSVVFSPIENPSGDDDLNDAMTFEHEQVPQVAYMTGQPLGVKLYRNRNTVSSGQTGYPGHPSNAPKSVDQGTQIITDPSYPHGKPLGGLVVPIGEMGPDPSYPGGKPVVGPTSHHGTPLVDPTHSHGSPIAGPSHSHGTPLVDATISHGTPFVDPAISQGTPFVDPSISHETPFVDPAISHGTPFVYPAISHWTPFVDPAISHGTPFVDPTISHWTPFVDPAISHWTPFVDPAISHWTPLVDPAISHWTPFVDPNHSHGTPLVDTTISHGTPFVDPNHSHGTPLVDTTISHGTPFVDPTISHGTPFVDPSSGLGDPIINPANGPGFVDPAFVDPRLDGPGPILPGPVSGQPGTSFSQSGPNQGEPSTPGLGQPWPGRAPTRHILPRPTPQAFVETGGPTLENVVGRDQLATDPLGPAAGRPGD